MSILAFVVGVIVVATLGWQVVRTTVYAFNAFDDPKESIFIKISKFIVSFILIIAYSIIIGAISAHMYYLLKVPY